MKLLKEFPRALWISLTIFLVLLGINLLLGAKLDLWKDIRPMFIYTMVYGMTLYYANAVVFMGLDRLFAKNRFTPKRLVVGFLASFTVTIGMLFLLHMGQDVLIEGKSIDMFLAKESPANYLVSIIITLIVTLCIHAFYFYKALSERKIKEQQFIAGSANARFESLKNQIDPHFLFNSLNVLSSLIEENPETAQKFTTSLSKIYRYVLEQKDKEVVTVHEELAFAKTYMNLLKMRFENSITFALPELASVPEEAKVVPLSLQLLLENCIKHNVVSEQKPLHIEIQLEKDYLVITNNLQKKEVLQDRKGVGLQNIISRYALLTNRKVQIVDATTSFSVKIPILTKSLETATIIEDFNEKSAYLRASEKVHKLKEFYANLIAYCTVIPLLVIVNLWSGGYQWFWFPMMGWGFGLTMHAIGTFGYGQKWEERKIQELMKKNNNTSNKWN
ncbi:MAG: hypothetical protein RLZZ500_1124 [Bacteroidota bacterium]|jgi:two-component sensor histidine kinase